MHPWLTKDSNQNKAGDLPADRIDLDIVSVSTLQAECDDPDITAGRWPCLVDKVVDGGQTIWLSREGRVVLDPFSWAKTAPNRLGIFDVIIDAPTITLDHLLSLWFMGVIPGERPTCTSTSLS